MRLSLLTALIAAIFCFASASVADDPNAPAWRGTVGSTFQEWTFSTSSRPAVPETFSNPFGTPSAAINYEPPVGTGWKDTMPAVYGSAQGWWDIARGSITLGIINHPNISVNAWNDIQVQVTYWKDLSQPPNVVVTPSAALVTKTSTLVESGPAGGAWYMDLWTLHVDPNLNSETITVAGHSIMGSQVDRVVVDTRYVAVPESAAQARSLPDETVCELIGPVVTRAFDTFFYLEDLSRASGIRVNCASGQSAPAEGTAPKVSGVRRTLNGERVIDDAALEPGGTGTVPPLGMNNRAVTLGLSPQALLVTLWGRATVPSPTGYDFSLDDGSGASVRVELHGTAVPADGAYIAITGVLGADSSGPVLRVGQTDPVREMD